MNRFLIALTLLLSASTSLAAGRELAPREVGPTMYSARNPATAFAADRFLTVWLENRGPVTAIMGAFSHADGRPMTPEAIVLVKAPSTYHLQLVGTGDSYALFWNDTAGQMHMADIDLAGQVMRQITLPLPRYSNGGVGWNGTHFLAAVQHGLEHPIKAEAFFLDRSGAIVRSGIALDDQRWFRVEVVATGSGTPEAFAVITTGQEGLFAQRVSAAGGSVPVLLDPADRLSQFTVTANAGDVLVLWGTSGLRSVVLDGGAELSPIQVFSQDVRAVPIHAKADGGRYLVAVMIQDQQGQRSVSTLRLHPDGTYQNQSSVSVDVPWGDMAAASNEYVVLVVHDESRSDSNVSSVALRADGRATGPEVLSTVRARQFQPVLGAGGGSFLAIWAQQTGNVTSVRTAAINALGEPSNVRTLQDPAYLGSVDLPWNGSEYLAVTWSGKSLMARRLQFDGTPLDSEPIAIDRTALPAFWRPLAASAWAGDRWVIVYPATNAMMFATVSRSGVLTGPRKLVMDTPLPQGMSRAFFKRPAIAFDGKRLLMVWPESRSILCEEPLLCPYPPDEAYAIRLDADGDTFDRKPLRLPDEAVNPVSVASSGTEFLVLPDETARPLVIDGDDTSLHFTATDRLADVSATADVVWDGSNYVAALRYWKNSLWTLATKRVNRQGLETDAARLIAIEPPQSSQAPSISASPGLGILVANQETDIPTGAHAVVYREDELHVTGPRRRSIR